MLSLWYQIKNENTMKKTKFHLLVAYYVTLIVIFVSCNDDHKPKTFEEMKKEPEWVVTQSPTDKNVWVVNDSLTIKTKKDCDYLKYTVYENDVETSSYSYHRVFNNKEDLLWYLRMQYIDGLRKKRIKNKKPFEY